MDARDLVAIIITVHELAAGLAALVAVIIGVAGTLLFRKIPSGRRTFTVLAFAMGGALLTFSVTSRLFDVHALDVEVVRVGR